MGFEGIAERLRIRRMTVGDLVNEFGGIMKNDEFMLLLDHVDGFVLRQCLDLIMGIMIEDGMALRLLLFQWIIQGKQGVSSWLSMDEATERIKGLRVKIPLLFSIEKKIDVVKEEEQFSMTQVF
ncbi:MAG: hypothetical protein CSB13_11815 [Chloroflexi bacterium]|nr:MAG: hypothetical protein CSB13_11815 [Chloroflexota bacterium]